ncbi:NAD(P)/FAD-dependent oxidoreductase [Mesorhizobium neociceri]|uniref:FAD-binding oxidoreductase n=1 Tax=Mesorhizobium neociceri TaxID=1307853 RepID=A0A838B8M1_9HYPH|nr:FAD-binding oxidoreductase [Mesorhizobium neociceri]MBA1142321.1 FAD-binding oxidoreductase [Mesorhizobium neociceri]
MDTRDVVIVGGGIFGCAIAWHLQERGVTDISLIERDGLFSGTSSAAAGFISIWAVSAATQGAEEARLERYGLEFYAALHARNEIDFRQNGLLWVAGNEVSWSHMQSMVAHPEEPSTHRLDPVQVQEITGGVVPAGRILGGVLQPTAGQLSASKVGPAMAEELSRGGLRVDAHCSVLSLVVRQGRVVGVETSVGYIATERVVIAAGAWSNALLEPHGIYLPMVPHVATRLMTRPLEIPVSMPALFLTGIAPDGQSGNVLWVRQHEGGLVFGGMYTAYPRDMFVETTVPTRFDDVPIDGALEVQRRADLAVPMLPAFSRRSGLKVKQGAPLYTPDRRLLAGAVPGIDGLYVASGDNEFGMTHGPGLGRAMAEHITGHAGQPWVGLEQWRMDRFGKRYRNAAQVQHDVEKMLRESNDGFTLT